MDWGACAPSLNEARGKSSMPLDASIKSYKNALL
jgi:hypothetical protein